MGSGSRRITSCVARSRGTRTARCWFLRFARNEPQRWPWPRPDMATVTDLARIQTATTAVRCDVCIVGAGAAGLYLARGLADAGMDVVVVEAGGAACGTGQEVGIEAEFTG